MQRLPLYKWHVDNNGVMVDYADYQAPANYVSPEREHNTTRQAAGLFDLCYKARIRVRGEQREAFVQEITTNNLDDIDEGEIQHTIICNNQGGIIDSAIIVKAFDFILILVSPMNKEVVLSWLNQNKKDYNIIIEDSTNNLGMLGIFGPHAIDIIQQLAEYKISSITKNHFVLCPINNIKVLTINLNYSGENGLLFLFGALYTQPLWERIIEIGGSSGLLPVGLIAQETLRIENSVPLYGSELDSFTTPIEAGLDKYVKFEKRSFIGKSSLVTSTNSEYSKRLICFEMIRNQVPVRGSKILMKKVSVGYVTSGCLSPSLDKCIGMGYVDQENSRVGNSIQIDIDGHEVPAIIVDSPFYKSRKY